jgi:hypothetical protein
MTTKKVPTAFISYSWDDDAHKQWVHDFAARLRSNGIDVTLDRWHAVPGDQLPHFMEKAIRNNDYVIIVCTPKYRERSDSRTGGVGYEGDIITGEILTSRNHRKFIPVLRGENWEASAPLWLTGKYYVKLNDTPYSETQYKDLIDTIHGIRPTAPPLGTPPRTVSRSITAVDLMRFHCGVISGPALQLNAIANCLIWSEKFVMPLKAVELLPGAYVPFISELKSSNLVVTDADLIESRTISHTSPFEGVFNFGGAARISFSTSTGGDNVLYDLEGDSIFVLPTELMDPVKYNTLLHMGAPVEMLMKQLSTASFAKYLREGGLEAAPVFKPTSERHTERLNDDSQEFIQLILKGVPQIDVERMGVLNWLQFVTDEETIRLRRRFYNWINEVTQSNISAKAALDLLYTRYDDYKTWLESSKVTYGQTWIDVLYSSVAMLESLVKLRPSKAISRILEIRNRKYERDLAELSAPGREFALLYHLESFNK